MLRLNLTHQRLHQVGISEQSLECLRVVVGLTLHMPWSLLMSWSLLLPLVIWSLIVTRVLSLASVGVTAVVVADAPVPLGFSLFVLEVLRFFVLGKHLLSFVHEGVEC